MRTTLYALQKEPFESNYRYLQFPISRSQWESLLASVANSSDVVEILAEYGDDLAWSGDSLLLSGEAAIVLFEMCRARCQTVAFQVGDCDFFLRGFGRRLGATGLVERPGADRVGCLHQRGGHRRDIPFQVALVA